jgi:plastocyanin
MSIFGRRVSIRTVAGLALVLIVTALLPVMSKAPAREVRLVVRGMAFYVEGEPNTPNPTIRVRAGETVRVLLRNDDRGLTHDFAVPALGAALDPIRTDQTDTVTFDVPRESGTYQYVCRPHMVMMRGTIIVE